VGASSILAIQIIMEARSPVVPVAVNPAFQQDLLVGALDSISADGRKEADERRTPIERHPVYKDATDMELALEAARRQGAQRVIVIGGHGGRQDHYLANALLLPSPTFADLDIEWRAGRARLYAVHRALELTGKMGSAITLLAVGGPVQGVSTNGLRWNLHGEDLQAGSTRGVSNEFLADEVSITLEGGTLLVVVPDPEAA
jgi:thiamine pyrophosphokinase